MRLLLTIALYGVLAGLLATRPRADDIDIYHALPGASPTRLMFAIDLQAEANDILCNDAAAAGCELTLGAEVYAGLDLFGPGAGAPGGPPVERSADGAADAMQPDPLGRAASMAAGHWAGTAVDRYDALRAALRVVLMKLGDRSRGVANQPGIEVGLMALHGDDCAGAGPRFLPDYNQTPVAACSQGAYVLKGLTDVSDPAGLDGLLDSLAALPDPGRRAPWMAGPWTGHPYKIRDIYLELHRYLTGQRVFNGFLGTRDYGSQASGNLYHSGIGSITNDVLLTLANGATDLPLLAPDAAVMQPSSLELAADDVAGARYVSPIPPQEECAKIAMIHLQHGAVSPSHPDTNSAIAAPFAAGGLDLTLATGEPGDRTLIAGMASGEVGGGATGSVPVRSYFFALEASAADEAMAAAGGTGRAYSLAETGSLIDALVAISSAGSGESSTLVAASRPVNSGGGIGQDLYFALFRTEPRPLWPGNVKKLKLAREPGASAGENLDGELVAQAPLTSPPKTALSEQDGQILRDALTFWTDPLGADVQAFDPTRQEVSGRDGRSVTRGGAGQRLTGFLANTVGANNSEPDSRQVFTLDPTMPGELLALDANAATLAKIGALLDPSGRMTPAQGLELVRWIRGQDSLDADGDGNLQESRPWLLGAPLHSRPLAISYGARPGTAYSASNPDIRLFFGTNDGVFHSLRNTAESGDESGRESWAFIPPALLALQSSLAYNRGTAPGAHPYGIDGEAVAQIEDRDGDGIIEVGDGDFVRVFIGQRRGGRAIYAFDMSDPDHPRYLWVINHLSPGFDQLGLTFSTPRVARLDLGAAAPTPVLVFAGGYHGGWAGAARVGKDAGADADPIGNAVYVVDPADGSLIWRAVGPDGAAAPAVNDQLYFAAGLTHSVPSPVTLLDSDRNGVEDRAYVGDSGGNVWRIELTEYAHRSPGSVVTGNWHLTQLAALGGSGDSDRRFFHAPDVVQSRDVAGEYDGVVIVSGNRAAPRELEARNFAYLLKDRRTARAAAVPTAPAGPALGHGSLFDITDTCINRAAMACVGADLASGWRLELRTPGEKGLSTPLVSSGRVLFTSYIPYAETGPDPCSASPGFGRVYGVRLGDGSAALPPVEKFEPGEEPGEELPKELSDRFRVIGRGIPGAVMPLQEQVLIPGEGRDGGSLVTVPGNTVWRAYWSEQEVDTL